VTTCFLVESCLFPLPHPPNSDTEALNVPTSLLLLPMNAERNIFDDYEFRETLGTGTMSFFVAKFTPL
jgi:hypothetical protein